MKWLFYKLLLLFIDFLVFHSTSLFPMSSDIVGLNLDNLSLSEVQGGGAAGAQRIRADDVKPLCDAD